MKSRERRNFEKFGVIPGGIEVTPDMHRKIVAELQAADARLNQQQASVAPERPRQATSIAPGRDKRKKHEKHAFLQAVDTLKLENGWPSDRSMGEAIKRHPDLYRDFMSKGQKGRF